MPAFSYVARDSGGRKISGRLDAASESAVLAELSSRGLAPVRVTEAAARRSKSARVPVRQVARVYRQLADLLRAGVPLLRALRLLGRGKSHPALTAVVAQIAEEIAQGERLADAMGRHPRIFPPVQTAMVRAGERGAFLEQVLARLGTFLEHQDEVRSRVVGSLIYPVLLVTIAFSVVLVALIFFVPKFRDFYKKIELPLPTKILLGSSDLVIHWWPLLVVLGVAAVAGFLFLRRHPAVRRAWADWIVRLPVVGPLVRAVAVARFARTLGTLLENGIPMLSAMQISRDAAGHPALVEAVDRAMEAVRAGDSLAKPLGESGFLEDDTVEMVAVGESANNLATVLLRLADTLEQRSDRTIGLLIRLMEPAMLLALAGLVLFIFLALIIPMMRLSAAM